MMSIHQVLTLAVVAVVYVFFFYIVRGRGGSWAFSNVMGLLGAGEFVLLVKLTEFIVADQPFFFSAIAADPDVDTFWLYVVNPTVAIVLLSGFAVSKWLPVPAPD